MEGVRVTGIDAHCSVQVLWQYFDDRGGVVKAIYYPLINNDAVVIFRNPAGTTDVLTRNHEKWKVSPLPNQVFSRQRVWVESDLSMLVQATSAYQDALRNMGQLDLIVDSQTQELILSGQPYQIEWAWNYLSTLRDNQFHIARTLQTGPVTSSASGLSNGSADPAYSAAHERSHHDRAHSPRLSRDVKLHKDKSSVGDAYVGATSLRLEGLRNTQRELSPRSLALYGDGLGSGVRQQNLEDDDTLISGIKHTAAFRGQQGYKQTPERERRRRQDDANETFNNFASLPTSSNPAVSRDILRHTDPAHHFTESKRSVSPSTLPSHTELEYLDTAHRLETPFQSLDYRGSRDDYHVAPGGYQSLQTDFVRQRENVDVGEERTRRAYTGERGTSYMTTSHGAASDLPMYALSSISAELSQKQFQLGKGLKLKIYMDDITKTKTDAVVNAANWELKNIGGVAGALAKAAGPEMEEECSKLLRKHGSLATAQVVKTKAYGKLAHLKYVIHTVGPIYIETDTERSVFELTQTFYNCLEFAEKLHLRAITFPFISTGIFGMPIEHCVLALVTALKLFSDQQTGSGGQLEEMHFINNDINVVCEAIIMTEQRLSMETVDSAMQRFEEGKKCYGRYVFPYCQSGSVRGSRHADNERYATWDSSQQRHMADREDTGTGRSAGLRTPQDPAGTGDAWSLPHFGAKSDPRQRSSSLDRASKTLTLGSSLSHSSPRTAGRDPSPRPQARPRSNSLTLAGKTVNAAPKGSASTSPSQGGSGGGRQQPVIKKSLTGSSTKSTGLAKRLANKKGAQSAGRSADHSGNDTDTASAAGSELDDGDCLICMEPFRRPRKLPCGHVFCASCIEPTLAIDPRCPRCQTLCSISTGSQPKDGTMSFTYSRSDLPGYEGSGTIVIKYVFPSGKQEACHPNPGQPYEGVHHTAYLPDNVEGNKVLKMLREAFDRGLVFTVGERGTITWNGIHHKTSRTGGPAKGGYPDARYLRRVKEELAAKGITSA